MSNFLVGSQSVIINRGYRAGWLVEPSPSLCVQFKLLKTIVRICIIWLGARGKPSTYVYQAEWLVEPFLPPSHKYFCLTSHVCVAHYAFKAHNSHKIIQDYQWSLIIVENSTQCSKIFDLFRTPDWCQKKTSIDFEKQSLSSYIYPRSFLEASCQLSRKLKISCKSLFFWCHQKIYPPVQLFL